jgi:polyhydroxyalkanoate synthesis regulator phasin
VAEPETRAHIDDATTELQRHMTEVFESIRADVRCMTEYLRLHTEKMNLERVDRLEDRVRRLEQRFEILEESRVRELCRRRN